MKEKIGQQERRKISKKKRGKQEQNLQKKERKSRRKRSNQTHQSWNSTCRQPVTNPPRPTTPSWRDLLQPTSLLAATSSTAPPPIWATSARRPADRSNLTWNNKLIQAAVFLRTTAAHLALRRPTAARFNQGRHLPTHCHMPATPATCPFELVRHYRAITNGLVFDTPFSSGLNISPLTLFTFSSVSIFFFF